MAMIRTPGESRKQVNGEDTTADGQGDLLSEGNGTDEFRDGRKDTSLDQGERP